MGRNRGDERLLDRIHAREKDTTHWSPRSEPRSERAQACPEQNRRKRNVAAACTVLGNRFAHPFHRARWLLSSPGSSRYRSIARERRGLLLGQFRGNNPPWRPLRN